MAYKSLQQFVEKLESSGELIRIKEFVSPYLEITEITDRVSKHNGKALLFENTGTDFPLLINAYGSYKRMCLALCVNSLEDVGIEMEKLLKSFILPQPTLSDKLKMLPKLNRITSWMPRLTGISAPCQEIIMPAADLEKLPVLHCWPLDGGKFITLPLVHTKDLHSGIRNVGMYRMQLFGKDLTAMHWHLHKGSAKQFLDYKKARKKMPVAVALGGDPVYAYAATAPLPENTDEYIFAGFLRKKRVELVRCISQDIEVPADVDIVIEGYIDPDEDLLTEGPFGDHTGYYSLPDKYPGFHVTCITHRKNAIYPATIVGIPPQEDYWIGKATERIFLTPIKMTLCPEITDLTMPAEGVFHNIAIVKIKKNYEGQALKVMNALWGAGQMMFNKILVVVDEHTDIQNYKNLVKKISDKIIVHRDIHIFSGPADVLDHASRQFAFGGKAGIDATAMEYENKSEDYNKSFDFTSQHEKIIQDFREITSFNACLCEENIPILFLAFQKNRLHHIREIHQQITAFGEFGLLKCIAYLDADIDLNNINVLVWRICNNIDPARDIIFNDSNTIGIDATAKTKEYDNFNRDWPHIITMNEAIIGKIDKQWNSLGLGEYIESPSLKFLKQGQKSGFKLE